MLSMTRMYCCAYFLHRMSERLYHNIIVITMNVCDCHMKDHWGTGQLCFLPAFLYKKKPGQHKNVVLYSHLRWKICATEQFFLYIHSVWYFTLFVQNISIVYELSGTSLNVFQAFSCLIFWKCAHVDRSPPPKCYIEVLPSFSAVFSLGMRYTGMME